LTYFCEVALQTFLLFVALLYPQLNCRTTQLRSAFLCLVFCTLGYIFSMIYDNDFTRITTVIAGLTHIDWNITLAFVYVHNIKKIKKV